MHGGKWSFKKISDGTVATREINDTTPSKISAVIAEVADTLSTTVADISYRGIHDYSTDAVSSITVSQINHNPSGGAEGLH